MWNSELNATILEEMRSENRVTYSKYRANEGNNDKHLRWLNESPWKTKKLKVCATVIFRTWYGFKSYLDLYLLFRELLLLFSLLSLSSLLFSALPLLLLPLSLLFQFPPSPLLSFFFSYSLELKRIMYIQYKIIVYNMQSDGVLTCFSNFLFLMYSSKGVVLLAANKVIQRENRA